MAKQTLLQAAFALNAVIAQAYIQRTDRPLISGAVHLGLQHSRLPPQPTFEVEVGVQAQSLVFEFPGAAQRSSQGARQFSQPIRRVDRTQVQRCIPAYAIGKLQVEMTIGLAMARSQF